MIRGSKNASSKKRSFSGRSGMRATHTVCSWRMVSRFGCPMTPTPLFAARSKRMDIEV